MKPLTCSISHLHHHFSYLQHVCFDPQDLDLTLNLNLQPCVFLTTVTFGWHTDASCWLIMKRLLKLSFYITLHCNTKPPMWYTILVPGLTGVVLQGKQSLVLTCGRQSSGSIRLDRALNEVLFTVYRWCGAYGRQSARLRSWDANNAKGRRCQVMTAGCLLLLSGAGRNGCGYCGAVVRKVAGLRTHWHIRSSSRNADGRRADIAVPWKCWKEREPHAWPLNILWHFDL